MLKKSFFGLSRSQIEYELLPARLPEPDRVAMANSPDSTSDSLLIRVRGREREAWDRLFWLYTPLVYRWCRRYQLSDEDLEDVTQDVFQAVYDGIDRFHRAVPRPRFRQWLWGITRHKISDQLNRRRAIPRPQGGDVGQALINEIPEHPPEDSEDGGLRSEAVIVRRVLALLRPDYEDHTWKAFLRTAVDNQRAADVAADLGMTTKAVRQAKYRILRRLRLELQQQIDS